jgi:hypothetical protein
VIVCYRCLVIAFLSLCPVIDCLIVFWFCLVIEREKERVQWCNDLGLSVDATWEKVILTLALTLALTLTLTLTTHAHRYVLSVYLVL